MRNKLLLYLIGLFLLTSFVLFPHAIRAEVIERVVSIVNDEVILLSEFTRFYDTAQIKKPDITRSELLEKMIDRLLLLKQAKKFRLTISGSNRVDSIDEDAVIKEYVDIRLKGFIHVPYEDIEYYYYQNKDTYGDREFYNVRDEIEKYLVDREFEVKLVEFINDLRKDAYIRVQLDNDN